MQEDTVWDNMYPIPPRGLEPLEEKQYPIVNKELTANKNTVLSTSLDILLQKSPELKQILSAWPNLPDHIKQAIKALIQTHITENK